MKIHPRIWNLVAKMYSYCYPTNFQRVLSQLRLEHDCTNVNNETLVNEFAKLGFDDGIKVIEEILQNQQLLSDETERLEIENYEFSKFQALNSVPFRTSNPEPPKQKKDSGEWRRQLIEYLRKDGFIFNERNGKLNQPIENLKPAVNKISIPEIKEYYHVRLQIERGSGRNEYQYQFNLDEKSLLEEVVRKYNEEGIDNFYFNGHKVYPSDSYALTILRTWLDKENITIQTKFDKLWIQVEKKGKDVTDEYIKIPSNPWRDKLLVCLGGHVINTRHNLEPHKNIPYCDQCGKETISNCPNCGKPLPGDSYKPCYLAIGVKAPLHCSSCGYRFPWVNELAFQTEYSKAESASLWIENLFFKFHSIVTTLGTRSHNRLPFVVNDEYDIQYLLMALLRLRFSNIVPEAWTPTYAGSSKKMDFLMKDEKIVIETKITRKNRRDTEVGDELIVDIDHYKRHPECKNLFCFIYDPNSRLVNPQGLRDLEKGNSENFAIHVIVSPQF